MRAINSAGITDLFHTALHARHVQLAAVNLTADHSESADLTDSHPTIAAAMVKGLATWVVSVQHSMSVESHCAPDSL